MAVTRKQFLRAASGASVLVLLQACGGGGYDDDEPGLCGASAGAIAGNHGHALTIPASDLDATTPRTYDISGTANHAHSVTFTPAQLQELRAGRSVTITSSTGSGHSHAVTASCA